MDLHRVRFDDPLVAPLITGLAAEYEVRYGPNGEMARTSVEEFDPPGGAFVVLTDSFEGTTVAGGGFRWHTDQVCEVKRMWTAPSHRGQGLAARVLDILEEAAREAGYARLVLETGPRQPEAVRVYERRGYRRVAAFGPYQEAISFEFTL